MKIVITGGAGFVGSHIARVALQAGHEVLVVDNLSRGKRDNVPRGASLAVIDLRDGAAVRAAFRSFRPEAVCHQARATGGAGARESTLEARADVVGSLELIAAAAAHDVERFVFASAGGYLYGELPEQVCASATATPRPRGVHACAKLAVENYLGHYERSVGLRHTILRYANVYGPGYPSGAHSGVIGTFAERLMCDAPVSIHARERIGDEGCLRDYVFVGDVARVNLAALEGRVSAPIMNVCTGAETSTREILARLRVLIDSTSTVTHTAPRAGELKRSVLDAGPMHALGPTTPLNSGLAQTITWLSSRTRHGNAPLDMALAS